MTNHHRDVSHLRVVAQAQKDAIADKSGVVIAPLPPIAGVGPAHAAALLHMMATNGYATVSATGPGLAMAANQLNFTAEGRYRSSSSFVADRPIDLAVLYARTAEFARIAAPRWYKRRLEELRRIRFVARLVATAKHTCLVLEQPPVLSRYQFCFWATARVVGWLTRRRVTVVRRQTPVDQVFTRLTGVSAPVPPDYLAAASSYDAAFAGLGEDCSCRVGCTRTVQAAQAWAARTPDVRAEPLLADLAELVDVFRAHDLRQFPQFRLLRHRGTGRAGTAVARSRAARVATERDPAYARLGLPISRLMTHLRRVAGVADTYPLRTRAEGRSFLNWAIWEIGSTMPDRSMPVTKDIRSYLFAEDRKFGVLSLGDANDAVAYAGPRDARPFPVSPRLAAIHATHADLAHRYDLDQPADRVAMVLEVLLRAPDETNGRGLIGPAAADYLTAPVGGQGFAVSRLAYLMALMARFELTGRDAIERPWEAGAISTWMRDVVAEAFPSLRALVPRVPARRIAPHTLTITGLPTSETGVGQNLHMSHAAFARLGVPITVRNTAKGLKSHDMGAAFVPDCRLKRPVAVHHVNADQIPQTLVSRVFSTAADTYHIGFLLWEFDTLPDTHRLALDMLDEIWVPTEFLRAAYARATDTPVFNVGKGLDLPPAPPLHLPSLGAAAGTFTFLTCFDFHSSVARKNPLAAVRAFRDAFPASRGDVQMIVKTTPTRSSHWGDPEGQIAKIRTAAAQDHRITLVERQMPFADFLGLIAASDALVSPHRAEGFGLIPAYALALRRPVIATDYSGTRDFCTPATGIPVRYRTVSVPRGHTLHPMTGATWAEIDLSALAQAMADSVADPAAAAARAGRGAALVADNYSVGGLASRYRERLTAIGALG